MTHDGQSTAFNRMIQLLADEGFEGMAEAITILVNEAMKLERSEALNAEPYERTPARRGYANGFKPKTFHSRLGKLTLQVPQARGVAFYPSALERGERSERALKLAVAEMFLLLEQSRAMLGQAAAEGGVDPSKEARMRALAAQHTVMENANEICRLAIRTCGGQAMLRSLPLERIYRDSRCGSLMLPWTAELCLDRIGREALYEAGETDD